MKTDGRSWTPESQGRKDLGDTDPLQSLLKEFDALRDHSFYLASVKVDQARLRLRRLIHSAAIRAGSLVFATTVIILAGIYVARGVSGGFAAAFGNRYWAGNLVGGLVLLGGVLGGSALIASVRRRKSRTERIRKYAKRRALQRRRSGGDESASAREAA